MELSLREIKYAKTKFDIVEATRSFLLEGTFAECSVKDICKKAQISEATFFNYFSKKEHLLSFIAQIESTKILLKAKNNSPEEGLKRVEWLVHFMGQKVEESLGLMVEFLFCLIRKPFKVESISLTPAEVKLFFETEDNHESIQIKEFGVSILENIIVAHDNGSLSKDIDAYELTYSIMSMIIGIPILLQREKMHECPLAQKRFAKRNISQLLSRNLAMIFKGAGVKV
ncbi:MAG: TetR/AcrR family transcriptional regulator [Bacteriovoracia bacterium]